MSLCLNFKVRDNYILSSFTVCNALLFFLRLQDAVSLVSLFHMLHPHSGSAQEAASQQATGTDLLKVRTTQFSKV